MLCDFLVGPIDCSLVPHRLPWTAIYFPMFLILSICKASRIDEAIQRMQIVVLDSYDNVSVFSIYWKSVDNGGAEDSSLFIQTFSKLWNVQTCQQSLSDDHRFTQAMPSPVAHLTASLSSPKLVRSWVMGQKSIYLSLKTE